MQAPRLSRWGLCLWGRQAHNVHQGLHGNNQETTPWEYAACSQPMQIDTSKFCSFCNMKLKEQENI